MTTLKNSQLDVAIWVLIYGGLLALGLGLATPLALLALQTWLIGLGVGAIAGGCGLVALRARRPPDIFEEPDTRPAILHGPTETPRASPMDHPPVARLR